jgi:hypothetical protein
MKSTYIPEQHEPLARATTLPDRVASEADHGMSSKPVHDGAAIPEDVHA